MRLVVGLGNPGDKYKDTLHNVGFSAIDAVGELAQMGAWQAKHKGVLSKGSYKGHAFLLLKPQTYMNISGESVQACRHFYKIELDDILVISDDIDRPIGSLRYRKSGGHGGHNGLRSIIQSFGSDQFHRIKIGIGRPGHSKMSVSDYVLSRPEVDTELKINQAIKESSQYILDFIEGKPVQIQPSQSTDD